MDLSDIYLTSNPLDCPFSEQIINDFYLLDLKSKNDQLSQSNKKSLEESEDWEKKYEEANRKFEEEKKQIEKENKELQDENKKIVEENKKIEIAIKKLKDEIKKIEEQKNLICGLLIAAILAFLFMLLNKLKIKEIFNY